MVELSSTSWFSNLKKPESHQKNFYIYFKVEKNHSREQGISHSRLFSSIKAPQNHLLPMLSRYNMKLCLAVLLLFSHCFSKSTSRTAFELYLNNFGGYVRTCINAKTYFAVPEDFCPMVFWQSASVFSQENSGGIRDTIPMLYPGAARNT